MSGILLNARRSPTGSRDSRSSFAESNPSVLRLTLRLCYDVTKLTLWGAVDSLRIGPIFTLTIRNSAFRRRLFKCFLLNGVILLWIVLGWVWLVCRRVLPISMTLFFGWEGSVDADGDPVDLDFWPDVCMTLAKTLLVSPLYMFALPFNTLWYRDMAKMAYEASILSHERCAFLHSTPSTARGCGRFFHSLTLPLSQMIHRLILTLLFTAFVSVSNLIGGSWLSIIQLSLLTSYYACEYRWDLIGRSTDARFFEFETSWIYHLGFGLPTTLAMIIFDIQSSVWGSICICLLFPWMITNALFFPPQQTIVQAHSLLPLREITHRELRKRSGKLFWAGAKHGIKHSRRARKLWASSPVDASASHQSACQLTTSVLGFLLLLLTYQGLSVLIQLPFLSLLSGFLDAATLRCRSIAIPTTPAEGIAGGFMEEEDTYQMVDQPPTPPSRIRRRSRSRPILSGRKSEAAAKTDKELCDLVLEQRSELVHRFLR
eukprot:Blabericola_migrator_1__2864@NODE_181_length_11864_cov_121_034161_g157_i0_p4_GENE_NODE_181_length_11864_cov_121_034161_g157_i0NODE_181_length_11864_cov_121_034161_g157_i0_p4_ORF_typecomplete_len487_score31_85EI24/PF07264_11/2_9e15EI24/PF07264_11/4e03_NODE_181_length_11864_cov_121_034161_g157_i0981411274